MHQHDHQQGRLIAIKTKLHTRSQLKGNKTAEIQRVRLTNYENTTNAIGHRNAFSQPKYSNTVELKSL